MGITRWDDLTSGAMHIKIEISDEDARAMGHAQWEMLRDAGMLIEAALCGDVASKFLPSLGVRSHI